VVARGAYESSEGSSHPFSFHTAEICPKMSLKISSLVTENAQRKEKYYVVYEDCNGRNPDELWANKCTDSWESLPDWQKKEKK